MPLVGVYPSPISLRQADKRHHKPQHCDPQLFQPSRQRIREQLSQTSLSARERKGKTRAPCRLCPWLPARRRQSSAAEP